MVTHGGLEKAPWEQASGLFLNLKPHAAYAAPHSAANCVGAGTSTLTLEKLPCVRALPVVAKSTWAQIGTCFASPAFSDASESELCSIGSGPPDGHRVRAVQPL